MNKDKEEIISLVKEVLKDLPQYQDTTKQRALCSLLEDIVEIMFKNKECTPANILTLLGILLPTIAISFSKENKELAIYDKAINIAHGTFAILVREKRKKRLN